MVRRLIGNNVRGEKKGGGSKVSAVTITRIKLEKLFGLYTYDIPAANGSLGRAPILYGENGYGKTNVLKVLFHLLSASPKNGHRTALTQIKFKRADVYLSNGIIVSAIKQNAQAEGMVRFEVSKMDDATQLLGAWDMYPDDDKTKAPASRFLSHVNHDIRITEKLTPKEKTKVFQTVLFDYFEKESNPLENEEAFIKALSDNVPPMFFLGADRILTSDHVREVTQGEVDTRFQPAEIVMRMGRERALKEALSAASRRFSHLAVQATNLGSRSTHSIYQDMLRRLASRSRRKNDIITNAIPILAENLTALSERYSKYAKYGLAPELDGDELISLIGEVRTGEQSVAGEILRPYVESLQEQANSFEKAYEVIHTLVSTVNEFLFDKAVEFKLGEGMVVRNRIGEIIEPHDLSSGEQQLLLLFCHVAIANETGGIFIIDEPEISLNIRWQRRLVDALLRLDLMKNLQFVLASHSMEILTRHRESVVELKEVTNA